MTTPTEYPHPGAFTPQPENYTTPPGYPPPWTQPQPPKRRAGAVVGVLALVATAGIGIGVLVSQAQSSGVSSSDDSSVSADDTFVETAREIIPRDTSSDSEIVELGETICNMWAEDFDLSDVVGAASGTGITRSQAARLAGAATAIYCPSYSEKVGA